MTDKIKEDYKKDLRYSRQIGTYGNETMKKLSELKILIIGLKGLGVEVAKNIILSGPKRVSLYDKDLEYQLQIRMNQKKFLF